MFSTPKWWKRRRLSKRLLRVRLRIGELTTQRDQVLEQLDGHCKYLVSIRDKSEYRGCKLYAARSRVEELTKELDRVHTLLYACYQESDGLTQQILELNKPTF